MKNKITKKIPIGPTMFPLPSMNCRLSFQRLCLSNSEGPEEDKFFLKVVSQLKVEGKFSNLFVEGIYDTRMGRMYLIGCRDVRDTWNVLHADSGNIEDGLGFLAELKLEYPPTNSRWFINPTVKISIKSNRNEYDPLFCSHIKIYTLPIQYRRQREEITSHKSIEGMLHILTLSVMIRFILS